MDTTPERRAVENAEKFLPSWLRPGDPESRWPVLIALLTAIVMQRQIPERYTILPRWPLIICELALLAVLLMLNPIRLDRRTLVGKYSTWVLLAAITADNIGSAAVLDKRILTGEVSNNAGLLLGSGAAIFITNVIVFGIWYWELDRGGPFARHAGENPYPAFLFPQMDVQDAKLVKPDWRPTFVDYLYLSITNVMAFSPTDTMPLARWAKMMMTVQAMIALSTAGLVIARAVNVLG
jgi:hypothetical protein